jgi:PPM family protein phosphatase
MPPFTIEQRGRATVGCMRGRTHTYYEDRFRLLTREVPLVAEAERGEILAVFDGIGGLRQGMHAAQHMADLLIEFFEHSELHAPEPGGLAALLLRGSREIRGWGPDPETGDPAGGCVGTLAWLNEGSVHLFHLGDSEGWLSRGPGLADRVTETHGSGHALTQFFGLNVDPSIQVASFAFTPGMRLLLTSDGVRNARITEQVTRILGERKAPRISVQEICGAAVAANPPDDITVLLVV